MGKAKDYLVRLYLDGFEQVEEAHSLDTGNDNELASTLRQMVRRVRNDNRLSDREYSRYVIHVHEDRSGRYLAARCWVSSTGAVRVKR
jgi:hypothetical protein